MTESPNEQSVVPAVPGIGEVEPYDGPPLVYGLIRDFTLAVVPREWAERGADELAGWLAARTWREALAVADSMTVLKSPFHPEEKREELGDDGLDGPFNALWQFGYVDYGDDGTFPTLPEDVTSMTVPEDWGFENLGDDDGRFGPYGDSLYIFPSEEPVLLASARAAGAELVRDDDLVNRLLWPGDRPRTIAGTQP